MNPTYICIYPLRLTIPYGTYRGERGAGKEVAGVVETWGVFWSLLGSTDSFDKSPTAYSL